MDLQSWRELLPLLPRPPLALVPMLLFLPPAPARRRREDVRSGGGAAQPPPPRGAPGGVGFEFALLGLVEELLDPVQLVFHLRGGWSFRVWGGVGEELLEPTVGS